MESIIAIFKKLADWIKELVETCKKFAAGWTPDYPAMDETNPF